MTTPREPDDVQRARKALEALTPAPAPDPAFRARMRASFTSAVRPDAREPVEAPRVIALNRWAWTVVAAAAALVAVTALLVNPGEPWRVVAVSGSGIARVNGHSVPLTDVAELERAIVPGADVRVPEGAVLEIASHGLMAIQMEGGTEAVVPRVPGRWFERRVIGTLRSGEWRLSTGPRFPGARFAITTPDAHVEITGTTIAVLCLPEGTCVCVYEGRAHVGHDARDMAPVEGGRRREVFRDPARGMLDEAILPQERPALGAFCTTARARLRGAR